jgi:hypothetical protein
VAATAQAVDIPGLSGPSLSLSTFRFSFVSSNAHLYLIAFVFDFSSVYFMSLMILGQDIAVGMGQMDIQQRELHVGEDRGTQDGRITDQSHQKCRLRGSERLQQQGD